METDIFNQERMQALFPDDLETQKEMAVMALENIPELMGQISEHLTNDRIEDAILQAHSLKGLALNIGGERLGNIARKIEYALKDDSISDYNSMLKEMREESENLKAAISLKYELYYDSPDT